MSGTTSSSGRITLFLTNSGYLDRWSVNTSGAVLDWKPVVSVDQ